MKRTDVIRLPALLMIVAPISLAQDPFDQGVEASRRGDYDRALDLFKQAVALDPNKADPHAYLGSTYLGITSRSAAITEILKDPQASAAMSGSDRLAAAKMVVDIPETERLAEVELRRALELDPMNEVALQWLVILANHGHVDLPKAVKVQKMADSSILYDRLTLAFADGSLRRLAESRKLLPDPASDSTGKLYMAAGELIQSSWNGVVGHANASPLDPTGPLPNPMRQTLRAKYARIINEGLADLQQALRLDPGNSSAMIGTSYLIRDQAVLRDTQAEYDADVAVAKQWMNRGFDAREAQSHPASAPSSAPARASDQEQATRLIRSVTPNYPPAAIQAHVTGTVRFAITIARDGRATNLRPLSGNPILFEAAEGALKQWMWHPKFVNGNVVETETEVEVRFSDGN